MFRINEMNFVFLLDANKPFDIKLIYFQQNFSLKATCLSMQFLRARTYIKLSRAKFIAYVISKIMG